MEDEDTSSPSSRLVQGQNIPPELHSEEQTRRFLAKSIVGLLVLELLIYAFTKDIAILGTTTVIGAVAVLVFRYYFTRRDRR